MFRSKTSIAIVVAVVLVAATTLTLGSFAWFNYSTERQRQTASLKAERINVADQLAVSLALPAWNFDRAQIDKIIESAMQDRNVAAIVVQLADVNHTIHARARDTDWKVRMAKQEPASTRLMRETRNITADAEVVGTVQVYLTTRFMEEELDGTLAVMLVNIVLYDLLLILGLFFLLWRLVLRPLKLLEHHAAAVCTGGTQGLGHPEEHFRGELENLRASLDKMVRLLNVRYTEVQESEARLRAVVNSSPDCIAVAVDERLVYLNPAGLKMFGMTGLEAGRSIYDFVPAEIHERVRARRREVLERGIPAPVMEIRTARTDGLQLEVEAQAVPIVYDGRPAILNLIRDITERKLAGEALRKSEERLRLALEAARMGTWERDFKNNKVVWSAEAHALFGVKPDKFAGTFEAFLERVKPEDREPLLRRIGDTISGREPYYLTEYRVVWEDGSEHWLEGRGRLYRDENGQPLWMSGTVTDVTQRKVAEGELRASEERFRSYFELPIVGLCITSLEKGFIAVNNQLCMMLGYSREELMRKRWPDLTHSDDLAVDLALFTRVLAGESASYSTDTRFLRKDGTIIYATVSVRCVRRPDGAPDYFIGLVQDITKRKRAEDALRENQRRLATLLSNLPGLTYRCRNDADWSMEFVSEGCRELTGHEPDDLVENRKLSYASLIHPDDQGPVWDKVQAALAARVPFEITYRIHTAARTEKWVWERGQGVFSADGAVLALEGFITDITARHQAEAEREEALWREQYAREEYTRQLIASQEAERRRIAGELHDSLGQNLLLLKNRAQLALGCPGTDGKLREQIEGMKEAAAQAISEVRQISQDLHPYQIEQLGLTRALEAMIESVSASTSIVFERKLDDVDDVFQGDEAANVYRVVQESLNNILKHSGARRVRIVLERDVRDVHLSVEDDGRGFTSGEFTAADGASGFGLKNIAERVRILGGRFVMNSRPGQGVCMEVRVPIPGMEEGDQ